MNSVIGLLMLAIIVSYGIWYEQIKRYKKKVAEQEDSLTLAYEEVYIADRLTGFIKQLKSVEHSNKLEHLKLEGVVDALEQTVEIVERPKYSATSRELIILSTTEALTELEEINSRLNKDVLHKPRKLV